MKYISTCLVVLEPPEGAVISVLVAYTAGKFIQTQRHACFEVTVPIVLCATPKTNIDPKTLRTNVNYEKQNFAAFQIQPLTLVTRFWIRMMTTLKVYSQVKLIFLFSKGWSLWKRMWSKATKARIQIPQKLYKEPEHLSMPLPIIWIEMNFVSWYSKWTDSSMA